MNKATPHLLLLVMVAAFSGEPSFARNMVTVRGHVSDAKGNPLAGADIYFGDYVDVEINGKTLRKLLRNFPTTTDEEGNFQTEVEDRRYDVVFISKGYQENPTDYLEFWFWNYHPDLTTYVDVFIDRLEAYGLATWKDPGAGANLVYVRPMSLEKGLPYRLGKPKPADGHYPIAPALERENVEIKVDGKARPIWGLTKTRETAQPDGTSLDAYLITIPILEKDAKILCLKMEDVSNGESGLGCLGLQ